MNPEIVKMRNDLAMLRHKAASLREEASGAIPLIRLYLPPYGNDAVMSADTEQALSLCKRLHALKKDLVKTLADIKTLEEALGDHE